MEEGSREKPAKIKKHSGKIILAILLSGIIFLVLKCEFEPGRVMQNRIMCLDSDYSVRYISEITPFEWDIMYAFRRDYYFLKKFSDEVGFHCPVEILDDPGSAIIFVKNNKFVYAYRGHYSVARKLFSDYKGNKFPHLVLTVDEAKFFRKDGDTFYITK